MWYDDADVERPGGGGLVKKAVSREALRKVSAQETRRRKVWRDRWRQWVDRGITLLGYTECMF